MTSMPWVKLYTEMLDDPKMADLNSFDKWGFVQLILLAGECDKEGVIPLTVKQISWRLREPLETLIGILISLQDAGLITYHEIEGVNVLSFSKRQDRPQSEKREQWNDAQRRHRSKNNSVIYDSSMTDEGVILLDRDRDREEEEEIDRDSAHNPLNFDDLRAMVEKKTGYPIPNTEKDIKALQEFEKWGVIETDIDDAIQFFSNNNLVARGPDALKKSIQTSMARRIQKNGKKPYKDTKVWSEEC